MLFSLRRESFFNCGKNVSDIQGIFSETEDVLGPEFSLLILIRFFFFLFELIRMVVRMGKSYISKISLGEETNFCLQKFSQL